MGSERSLLGRRTADDSGAVIVMFAAAMGAVLVMMALVLDLGAARNDRASDQVAADAMALAGAANLGGSTVTAEAACEAAWSYLVVNLPTAASAPAPDCASFRGVCAPAPTAADVREVEAIDDGEYRITFVHPVPDGDELLAGQPAGTNDGRPCDRFGVDVEQSRANQWTSGDVDLDVDAVGRLVRGVGQIEAPLVLLSEHECIALEVAGSGNLSVDTASGEPGYIVIDSDGQGCDGSKKVVLRLVGNGAISADEIAMWALAGPYADQAFTSGVLDPPPIASSGPVGRHAVDWTYDCDPAAGCPGSGPAHISELEARIGTTGTPEGFTRWSSAYGCKVSGQVAVPRGDWHIDCPQLTIGSSSTLTFTGGDIVTDGPISVNGSGALRVNCQAGTAGVCLENPTDPSTLYMRSGDLVRNGDFEMRETFVYLAAGTFRTAGNSAMTWTAPDDEAYPFDDLLVWTESAEEIVLTGTADLYIEGIFFAPEAHIRLGGTADAAAMRAQIFASTAEFSGNATLSLRPEEDRMIRIGRGRPLLIR